MYTGKARKEAGSLDVAAACLLVDWDILGRADELG